MKLTVFTPTYNRAYSLPTLYNSLKSQTDKRFEWLICDDGSTDQTETLIQGYMESEETFVIKYLRQDHGGKHRAQNKAIREAEGDFFITCDSNKYLASNAVALIISHFEEIRGIPAMCGVGGYRADFCGNVYGGEMLTKDGYVDCTNLERRKYNLGGDKASAFYTEILRKYPFPEYDGEMFVSESAWLTPMAMDGYQIRWFPEILVYGEYTQDGLTKQGANGYRGHFDNFFGYLHVLAMEIKAYGLDEKRVEIYEAIEIAQKKGISWIDLCRKLNLSVVVILKLKIRRRLGMIKRKILQYK